jgi:hypothetical protein
MSIYCLHDAVYYLYCLYTFDYCILSKYSGCACTLPRSVEKKRMCPYGHFAVFGPWGASCGHIGRVWTNGEQRVGTMAVFGPMGAAYGHNGRVWINGEQFVGILTVFGPKGSSVWAQWLCLDQWGAVCGHNGSTDIRLSVYCLYTIYILSIYRLYTVYILYILSIYCILSRHCVLSIHCVYTVRIDSIWDTFPDTVRLFVIICSTVC